MEVVVVRRRGRWSVHWVPADLVAQKQQLCQYAVCETRRLDAANTCQACYNVNKKYWGTNSDLAGTCDWCDGDTGKSPSIGVPSDGTDGSSNGKFPSVPVRLE